MCIPSPLSVVLLLSGCCAFCNCDRICANLDKQTIIIGITTTVIIIIICLYVYVFICVCMSKGKGSFYIA